VGIDAEEPAGVGRWAARELAERVSVASGSSRAQRLGFFLRENTQSTMARAHRLQALTLLELSVVHLSLWVRHLLQEFRIDREASSDARLESMLSFVNAVGETNLMNTVPNKGHKSAEYTHHDDATIYVMVTRLHLLHILCLDSCIAPRLCGLPTRLPSCALGDWGNAGVVSENCQCLTMEPVCAAEQCGCCDDGVMMVDSGYVCGSENDRLE